MPREAAASAMLNVHAIHSPAITINHLMGMPPPLATTSCTRLFAGL